MTTVNTNNENFATDLVEEVNEYGIVENYSREQFEAHFRENREIKYKNRTVGIMEWGDGRFDVLTPADNECGYETLNQNPFMNPCDAINFAVEDLVTYSMDRNPDGTIVEKKASSKKKSAPKEPEYNGPRTIRVFGRDIYVEEDPKASNEKIRQKLVDDYNFPNFQKGKVYMDLDISTGIVEVLLKFQTKG